jgi:hypothetical protein
VIRAIHAGFDAAKADFSCMFKKKFGAVFPRPSPPLCRHSGVKKSMPARAENSVTK